jgi:hypothetical protein
VARTGEDPAEGRTHMTNPKLKAAVQVARTMTAESRTRCHFALVVKSSECRLLLGTSKPASQAVDKAKADFGGGRVTRGTCFGTDGGLLFETVEEPGANWGKLARTFLRDEAGVTIACEFRQNADAENFGEAGEHADEPTGAHPSVADTPVTDPPSATEQQPPVEAPAPPAAAPSPAHAAYLKARNTVAARLKPVLVARQGDFAQYAHMLKEAEALARTERYPEGIALLVQLNGLLTALPAAAVPQTPVPPGEQSATASQGSPEGISLMRLSRARLEWIKVRERSIGQIKQLQQTVNEEFKDDQEQRTALTTALNRLGSIFVELDNSLADQLDATINASGPEQARLAAVAAGTLQRFVNFVQNDELMQDLDGNDVMPSMKVTGPVLDRLYAIAEELG